MTIDVALATSDAMVLGCDSLSSINEIAFFPKRNPACVVLDEHGNPKWDDQGRMLIAIDPNSPSHIATTSVMGGVQKMFLLYEDANFECSVAAITSGMASISGMTIAEVADRYHASKQNDGSQFRTAREVVDDFTVYVRGLWEKDEFRSLLNFLIAGFGPDDTRIRTFSVAIAIPQVVEQFRFPEEARDGFGLAWDGQAGNAGRLLSGVDSNLKSEIERYIRSMLGIYRQQVAEDMLAGLADAGVEIPPSFSYDLRELGSVNLPWELGWQDINYRNLPLQTAVELTAALVNIESGMQKFAQGIPTVGGRTRIGILRRGKGFLTLNEPSLVHHHTGYHTDE
ncbi:hypothetical protein V3390_09060 [Luteimonas sp. FXH3W]|uniref:Uncharacterized protein n=1 Tax=Aquilutibacter rugosus TaxID=3115820 RepID=A0ABU7V0R8_9GAMM